MLTDFEKQVIASVQGDLPVLSHPYSEIADSLGVSEALVLQTLKNLCNRGVIRRFGATLRHQRSGFKANAMVAWRVDEDRIEEVGEALPPSQKYLTVIDETRRTTGRIIYIPWCMPMTKLPVDPLQKRCRKKPM